jgi:SAM-dependent methyltransferase
MEWFARDFDHPAYFDIYQDKEAEAATEGPGLAALLDLPRGSCVLDLPCGWGRLSPALAERGYQVTGGDLSLMNLQRLQREFPGMAVRLDLRHLPFREASADGVLCAYTSWGYFATDQENQWQLEEFARVLKPGGVLLLDLAGREFYWRALSLVPNHWYEVEGKYRERVRESPDGRRMITDRICNGHRFRHDIWIPTDVEARQALERAGFEVEEAFGNVAGAPWVRDAERWIYRCLKR